MPRAAGRPRFRSPTPAQCRFDCFPKALVAEWIVVGQAFTDVMEFFLR